MAENKKTLTITEEVKELIYDIQNKTHLTGQAREADNPKAYQAASIMQASDDDENSYQIRRSLANAFSALKSLLGSICMRINRQAIIVCYLKLITTDS